MFKIDPHKIWLYSATGKEFGLDYWIDYGSYRSYKSGMKAYIKLKKKYSNQLVWLLLPAHKDPNEELFQYRL